MTTRQLSQIPVFRSVQEEAEFWDAHDATEFKDEFLPVKVQFAKKSEGITVKFDTSTLSAIRNQAGKRGIGATTLIRMWVLERLHQPQTPSTLAR